MEGGTVGTIFSSLISPTPSPNYGWVGRLQPPKSPFHPYLREKNFPCPYFQISLCTYSQSQEGESPPPHIPASPFEIPYLATPKITPTPTDFACIEDEHADGVCPRKRKRAKRKLQVLDLETEIESQMFRNGLNDKSVGLREQSFTKQVGNNCLQGCV